MHEENRETRWPETWDGSVGEHPAEARAVEDHQERKHAARERAEYEREVYDHERQTGQHAEPETAIPVDGPAPAASYVIAVYGEGDAFGLPLARYLAPVVREAQENVQDLLPDGFRVEIEEVWSE